jgi:hypothetical protein
MSGGYLQIKALDDWGTIQLKRRIYQIAGRLVMDELKLDRRKAQEKACRFLANKSPQFQTEVVAEWPPEVREIAETACRPETRKEGTGA